MPIDRERVVEKLSRLFSRLSDVKLAILFGSTARGSEHPRDIDIAIKFSRRKSFLDLAELVSLIARELGIGEDLVDVVDLDEAKPILLLRILREGVILKGDQERLTELFERASRGIDQLIEVRQWAVLDPEPRVDKAVVVSRVDEIRRNAEFIKNGILTRSVDELEYRDVLALERAVHRIAEAMLDICRHLVAVYSLGIVESYGEYPRRLAEDGRMPRELAGELAKVAGLRNILVHRYLEIDLGKLYEAARKIVLETVPRFIQWARTIDC